MGISYKESSWEVMNAIRQQQTNVQNQGPRTLPLPESAEAAQLPPTAPIYANFNRLKPRRA